MCVPRLFLSAAWFSPLPSQNSRFQEGKTGIVWGITKLHGFDNLAQQPEYSMWAFKRLKMIFSQQCSLLRHFLHKIVKKCTLFFMDCFSILIQS